MATHHRRKRPRISYREDSSSEDSADGYVTANDDTAHAAPARGSGLKRKRTSNGAQSSMAQPSRAGASRAGASRSRRVSYKESSSESEVDEKSQSESEQQQPPRSYPLPLLDDNPRLSTTLRRMPAKSYQLPSSDVELQGDEDYDGEETPRPRHNRATRSRRTQAEPLLRRETPPEKGENGSSGELDAAEQSSLTTPKKRQTRKPRKARTTSKRTQKPSPSSKKRSNKLLLTNGATAKRTVPLESDGIIPPWSTLPYHVLLQIFSYASTPLCDDDYQPMPNITWLLNVARVCKTWAEPALTALYQSPPMFAIDKPHRLLDLLQLNHSDGPTGCIDYNVKVRRLEFDVTKSLAYTWTGRGQFDIGYLIPHVPQLTELTIVHPHDRPPFRSSVKPGRWHYTQAMFTALQESNIRLKSFTWNSNLCAKDQNLAWMGGIHQIEAFQRIEHLSLVNYKSYRVKQVEGEPLRRTAEQVLADNLALLPRLTSLSFESCPILTEDLFLLLKDNLESLTITNCNNVTSENLTPFLLSYGSQLKTLVLNHNRSLDISFLPHLASSCPRLEVLKMDLTYYSTMFTHDDSEPKYESLLDDSAVPTWPSTLRSLELVQLRKWTSTAAETFFASLIDSADQLPDLRHLVLKVILNIGWRDRAGFRDKWIGRLQRIFLRKSTPPAQYLMSGHRFRQWKEGLSPGPQVLGNRLSHVIVPPGREMPDEGSESPSKPSRNGDSTTTRSLRPRRTAKGALAEETESESEVEVIHEEEEEKFVQGMCEVVDVRIDNLRPREEQFNENDFLDSEVSGDEDWNEDDAAAAEGDDYAW